MIKNFNSHLLLKLQPFRNLYNTALQYQDTLIVDGQYHLKTEFEFEMDEDDPISKDERFNDREVFGSFGVKIDRNKKITLAHSEIMEKNGDSFFGGSFR